MKFKFYINKYIQWTPRNKKLYKSVVIEAKDLIEARKILYENYPGWEVSMFWPIQ